MSNYSKFDLGIIKTRIKEGTYENLIGANRAIGKTQGLSADDRATLKAYAAKHFGVEVAAPKTKKAGKKAAKKVAKKVAKKARAAKAAKPAKVAKKAAKKASKKVGKRAKKTAAKAAKVAAEPAPAATEPNAAVAAPKARKARKAATTAVGEVAKLNQALAIPPGSTRTPVQTAALIGSVIGTCDQMLKSIQSANAFLPKSEAEEANKAAVKVMERAILVLDQDVVSPLLADNKHGAVKPEKKAAAAASSKPTKVKGNGKSLTTMITEAPDDPPGQPRAKINVEDLTEEEQEELRLAEELADDNVRSIQTHGHLPPG